MLGIRITVAIYKNSTLHFPLIFSEVIFIFTIHCATPAEIAQSHSTVRCHGTTCNLQVCCGAQMAFNCWLDSVGLAWLARSRNDALSALNGQIAVLVANNYIVQAYHL